MDAPALCKVGKGFQGVVKRHGFGGVGQSTHGQHNRLRAPGSIGAASYPARVFKGMKMAGRMGGETVTILGRQFGGDWDYDLEEVVFRPATYWPGNTEIVVKLALKGAAGLLPLALILLLALSNLRTAFQLESNGRELLSLPPAATPADRVADIWGPDEAGQLLELDAEIDGIRVGGLIQRPDAARPTGGRRYLFVNGRPFRDRLIWILGYKIIFP